MSFYIHATKLVLALYHCSVNHITRKVEISDRYQVCINGSSVGSICHSFLHPDNISGQARALIIYSSIHTYLEQRLFLLNTYMIVVTCNLFWYKYITWCTCSTHLLLPCCHMQYVDTRLTGVSRCQVSALLAYAAPESCTTL